jgi:hypothetical protein
MNTKASDMKEEYSRESSYDFGHSHTMALEGKVVAEEESDTPDQVSLALRREVGTVLCLPTQSNHPGGDSPPWRRYIASKLEVDES